MAKFNAIKSQNQKILQLDPFLRSAQVSTGTGGNCSGHADERGTKRLEVSCLQSLSSMETPSFLVSLPLSLRNYSQQACSNRAIHRRCRAHPFQRQKNSITASLVDDARREAEISAIESQLRELQAPAAADLACAALSRPERRLPSTWRGLLHTCSSYSINGDTLTRASSRMGILDFLNLAPGTVIPNLDLLKSALVLSVQQRNRVISQRPDLLATEYQVLHDTLVALLQCVNQRELKKIVLRWPGVLCRSPESISRIKQYLSSPPPNLSSVALRSVMRRAPWILVYDVEDDMKPAIDWIRLEIATHSTAPLSDYVLASPQILATCPSRMGDVVRFLRDEVEMDHASRVSVIRQFPPLLTCSVEDVLGPAVDYIVDEVGVERGLLQNVVRAFPAVLTLDVMNEMVPVIDYFRSRGISNVARIVMRLPPILGYDLQNDIIPKIDYVENVLGLSTFDILKFPAFFSFDLKTRITPRTMFLTVTGRSVAVAGLSVVLSLNDRSFCEWFGVSLQKYQAFQKACIDSLIQATIGRAEDDEVDYLLNGDAIEDIQIAVEDVGNKTEAEKIAAADDENTSEEVSNNLRGQPLGRANHNKALKIDASIMANWPATVVASIMSGSTTRRKKRLRASLAWMPWSEIGER